MAERLLWCDLETTGLEENKHGIIQIAAVLTDCQFNVISYFQTLVKPWEDCEITDEALSINKKTRAQIEAAPDELWGWEALCAIGRLPLWQARFAGFNCEFDLKFLWELRERVSKRPDADPPYDVPYVVPWLCMFKEAKNALPDLPKRKCDRPYCNSCKTGKDHTHRLVDVCEHFGIKIYAHDAMGDLKATIAIAKLLFPQGVEPLEVAYEYERIPF